MHNMKPCILHNESKNIPNDIIKCNPFPHHENIEEGGSPLDLKVAHKCIEST
jgi:hypothetical protein